MFKRIIVGIDGSPASITASELAFKLGKIWEIPVLGMYIIDVRLMEESFLADLAGVLGFTYYEGISAKIRDFLETQGGAILDEFSARGRERGVKVSVMQTVGVPFKEITAQGERDDLIAVGRVGKKPVKGIMIGSNAEKVARQSRSPVLIVPEQEREIRRALVAYDGSDSAHRALEICSSMKAHLGYEIHVLAVEEEEGDLKKYKDRIDAVLGDDYECHCLSGLPEERIVEFCREKDVDMLFMGAYGKGRIKELFLGSVTSFIIHHLNIPLFLAKA